MKAHDSLKSIIAWYIGLPLTLYFSFGMYSMIPKKESVLNSKTIHGVVFGERYMPASGSSFNAPGIKSRYAFSIDTDEGRKSINVEDYTRNYKELITKESIDALIEPGTVVDATIQDYEPNQQVYNITANRIKVLGY